MATSRCHLVSMSTIKLAQSGTRYLSAYFIRELWDIVRKVLFSAVANMEYTVVLELPINART